LKGILAQPGLSGIRSGFKGERHTTTMQIKNISGRTKERLQSVPGVIPACCGSKRLPRKNIKRLCGQPFIAYTNQTARKSSLLTDFLVSSEDDEILTTENLAEIEPFDLYNVSIYGVNRSFVIIIKTKLSRKGRHDQYHSIDIDTKADFLVAEAYLNFKNNNLTGPENRA
jgi:hypothetical protein